MSVRVLVVDDSATMRGLIKATLSRDSEIVVVGEAANANDARAAIKELNPDVLTLDVEMPDMSGLDFLERLMRLRPTPVVMVSSLTHSGATTALRALQAGAVDCVGKPTLSCPDGFDDLAEKLKTASRACVTARRPQVQSARRERFEPNGHVVAIGASTGGVEALISVLSAFPDHCPPTVIAQHMPATFTRSFAERLDRLCAPSVAEAEAGSLLKPGHIYLAPGGFHLEVVGEKAPRCRLTQAEKVNGHRPSVDVLFYSIARVLGASAVGVILTGMGSDGADGLRAMRDAGAETLGQDEASSLVYGMPRTAFERGAVMSQLPLDRIGDRILHRTSTRHAEKVR